MHLVACDPSNALLAVKKFDNKKDADDFVAGKATKATAADPKKPQKFYAVAIGRKPGVYTEWTEAQKAFAGSTGGVKQQSFKTREEAVEFIRSHGGEAGQNAIKNEVVEPPKKKTRTTRSIKPIADNVLPIYTDGSSRGNGKVGAVAGVGVFFGKNDPRFALMESSRRDALLTHVTGMFPSASKATRKRTSVQS